LKNDVNVPTGGKKQQKNLETKLVFSWDLDSHGRKAHVPDP
jgi:hypothetical protein